MEASSAIPEYVTGLRAGKSAPAPTSTPGLDSSYGSMQDATTGMADTVDNTVDNTMQSPLGLDNSDVLLNQASTIGRMPYASLNDSMGPGPGQSAPYTPPDSDDNQMGSYSTAEQEATQPSTQPPSGPPAVYINHGETPVHLRFPVTVPVNPIEDVASAPATPDGGSFSSGLYPRKPTTADQCTGKVDIPSPLPVLTYYCDYLPEICASIRASDFLTNDQVDLTYDSFNEGERRNTVCSGSQASKIKEAGKCDPLQHDPLYWKVVTFFTRNDNLTQNFG